jgi:hypothetical protein
MGVGGVGGVVGVIAVVAVVAVVADLDVGGVPTTVISWANDRRF